MKLKTILFSLIALLATFNLTSCTKKYAEISITTTTKNITNGESLVFSSAKNQSETENSVEFLIENTGTKELAISSINLEGVNAERFTLKKSKSSNFELGKGIAESITLSLKTDIVGSYDAALVIKSDAKSNATFTLNLSGTIQ